MHRGTGRTKPGWTGVSKVSACLSVFVSDCLSASLSHCAHTYGSTPLPLPSPSSLRYVDLRLCSSPTITRATYEYDTSLLNGYHTARSKKELSKFSVSNCQERGKEEVREEVREREKRGGRREREKRGGRRGDKRWQYQSYAFFICIQHDHPHLFPTSLLPSLSPFLLSPFLLSPFLLSPPSLSPPSLILSRLWRLAVMIQTVMCLKKALS